jgi:ribonuclease E
MQKVKALIAIFVSLTLGVAMSTFMPGCQPEGGKPSSLVTEGNKTEKKAGDEAKAVDQTSAEKPAAAPADNAADQPSEDKSADKPAADKPAADKPVADKPAATNRFRPSSPGKQPQPRQPIRR